MSNMNSLSSPPSEQSVLAEQKKICEQIKASDPTKDCSETTLKQELTKALLKNIEESAARTQAEQKIAAQNELIYQEVLHCKKSSGVLCESPTGRRTQLAHSCPGGWKTLKRLDDKECSPEAPRHLQEIQAPTPQPLAHTEKKSQQTNITNILIGTLAVGLILVLFYRLILKFKWALWNSLLKAGLTITSSLGAGVLAFRWQLEAFSEIAGPSESLAGVLGIFPPLFAFGVVSSFVATGMIFTLWPPQKNDFLRNSKINFASLIGGFLAGALSAYLFIQKNISQPHHYSVRFQTALIATLGATILFVIVATISSFILIRFLGRFRR